METEDRIHYCLKGIEGFLLCPDVIICRDRTPEQINVRHTFVLDEVTCPACVIAAAHKASQHFHRPSKPADEVARERRWIQRILAGEVTVHFKFPDRPPNRHPRWGNRKRSRFTENADEVTCDVCLSLLARRARRRLNNPA